MPWYLYLAFKQLFPDGRRIPFFFLVAVLGVTIGVWILIVVQSVMGGFGQTYREKIVQTNGHIRIESGKAMYDYESIIDYLATVPEVQAAAPYALGFVMLQHGDRPTFPTVRGIDVNREREVIPIDKFLLLGSLDDLDDDSVLLSRSLAASIGATMGSNVEVFTPLMLEKLKEDEVLLPRELRVAGIYETGWADFDKSTMVSTLRLMQELYKLEGGVHGVSVRLEPGADEKAVAARIEADLSPPNRALTWLDMYEDWLWVLELEKNMMFVLLVPVVVVAAFAIGIAQLLIVIRKTREIGLLSALGGRPRQLVACFCFQGLLIGISGCILGVATAMVFLYFRNDVVYLFATLSGSQEVLIRFYQFADLPVKVSPRDLLIIGLGSLILMTAASLIPAWWASRMKPADALRNE